MKWIAIVLAVLVVAVLGIAWTRPASVQISRSARIDAPPEQVYALIVDLHAFNRWNPWAKMDPDIVLRYEGPESGVGAVSAWESRKVGTGRMTITETEAPNRIAIRLDFIEPFASTSFASFSLTGGSGATEVVWEMHGPVSFPQRVIGVFVDMERMMGRTFEDGLTDLRRIAEP
ncbi:MAG: SRPBCC family protein [Myxococcota bacterium]